MKKSDLVVSSLLVPLDFLALIGAAVTAYFIRFSGVREIRPIILDIPFSRFFLFTLLVALIWVLIFAAGGLYETSRRLTPTEELSRIFLAISTGALVVVLFFFFSRNLFASRFIILASWVLAIAFVSIERGLVRLIRKALFRRSIGVHRLLLIGDGDIEANLAKEIFSRPGWGFKIVERIPELTEQSLAKVRDYFRKRAAEEVILTDLSLERSRVEQLLDLTTEFNVIFKYFPGYFETQSSRLSVQTLAGLPVIEIKQTALEGWGRIFKRVFDIVIASSCLLVLIPFGLVVGTIIVLDSPGPMILGLKRVGVKGKEFTLYKFRSMIKDAHRMKQNAEFIKMSERAGPLFKIKNDPRVTRVGKFLRKTSIDELPQLWNVLRGDMSLVGPRPHEPEEVAAYAAAHKQLLAIKPGITGLAQISGRSHLTFEEEARIDISYLQNWSLFSDIIILIRTVGVVVLGKDAE